MHELSITRNVVSIVSAQANGRTVCRVTLAIGRLSGIEAEAIRFCFDLVAQGTAVEGAELVIDEVEGRGRCDACEREVQIDDLIAVCPCEKRQPLRIIAGEELVVRSMEVSRV